MFPETQWPSGSTPLTCTQVLYAHSHLEFCPLQLLWCMDSTFTGGWLCLPSLQVKLYIIIMYIYTYKNTVVVGPDKPVDCGCFEVISSHQQGICIYVVYTCICTYTLLHV